MTNLQFSFHISPTTRRYLRSLSAFPLLLVFLTSACYAGDLRLHYTVQPVPPAEGSAAVLKVNLHISGLQDEKTVKLQMPVWSPGDYHVQDFAQHVRSVRAASASEHVNEVKHPDANTWEITTDGSAVLDVSYELPNTPAGFFSENVKITEKFAFYNGPAVYMYVVDHKQDAAVLEIKLPKDWTKALTALPLTKPAANSSTLQFEAPDYDTLADSPVLAGEYATREFNAIGKNHTIAFFRNHAGIAYDEYVPVISKVVSEEVRMMGKAPYDRYVFFLDCGGPGGGLEHLNSTRIGWFPQRPARIAILVAHEFFHLWNVKRIRPEKLGPFDYLHVPKTRSLWFCEGVTSYYENLVCLRAGLINEREYLITIERDIRSLQYNRARMKVTADEASLRVEEGRGSDGFGGLSYYLKGALIGLCLDLKIRQITRYQRSLDDVMRDLMERYSLPKPGYPEDGLREAVIRAAGPEMGPFYDQLARSTEELPFGECLGYVGLRLVPGPNGAPRIEYDPMASDESRIARATWLSGRE